MLLKGWSESQMNSISRTKRVYLISKYKKGVTYGISTKRATTLVSLRKPRPKEMLPAQMPAHVFDAMEIKL